MLIANPIYDVVFKYLMDDNKVAKLFLSAIIGEEITELEFRSTEQRSDMGHLPITVYRLDFAAKIKSEHGERLVLLEIQKAKLPGDIMRFRRYVGSQYADPNNIVLIPRAERKGRLKNDDPPTEETKSGLPILTIYFLGHWLEHTLAPVIKVSRRCYDLTTGEELAKPEIFIESLTHDAFVIQVPALKGRRQTELLRLLSVFDQDNVESDLHFMNVKEDDFPEKYRPIIRRLQKASAEKQVRDSMNMEDDIVEAWRDEQRSFQARMEKKDQVIEEKDKLIEEKDQVIEEKDKEIERLKKMLGL